MQYAMLVYAPGGGSVPSAPASNTELLTPREPAYGTWVDYTVALFEAGVLLAGEALVQADLATTVRVRQDTALVTDGPFAETAELLVGFYLVDLPDLDAALRWAARVPDREWVTVEVRPVQAGPASAATLLSPPDRRT